MARDAEVSEELKRIRWTVLRFVGKEIKTTPHNVVCAAVLG